MTFTHIFTVGASVLWNVHRELSRKKDLTQEEKKIINKLDDWLKRVPGSSEEKRIEAEFKDVKDFFYRKLISNPKHYSPELNSYLTLTNKYAEYKASKIHLLLTDTGVGRCSGSLLRDYLSEVEKILVEEHVVTRWGWSPETFDEALLGFVDTLSKVIKGVKKRGDRVVLNLTGGFKPESGFALIVASLFDADVVYYTHELFRDGVVILPILKLTLDSKFVKRIEKVFKERHVIPLKEVPDEFIKRGLVTLKPERESAELRYWVKKVLEEMKVCVQKKWWRNFISILRSLRNV